MEQQLEHEKPKHAGGRPVGSKNIKRPLKEKDQKVLEGVCAGKPVRRAMLDAGYSVGYATTQSSAKLRKILPRITEIMDKVNVTDTKLIQKLAEGLDSTKVISANIIAPSKDGMKDADSMTKDFIDVPDFATRHKYLETGLKLRGHLREKLDVNVNVDLADRIAQARRALYAKEREIEINPREAVG